MLTWIFCTNLALANNYEEATKKAAEAIYANSPMKVHLEEKLEVYKANLTPQQKKVIEIILGISDTISNQRIKLLDIKF